MRKSKFGEAYIIANLKQVEAGLPVAKLCRERGISRATSYAGRSKHGGMDALIITETEALQAEDQERLKGLYTDLSIKYDLIKKTLGKKYPSYLCAQNGEDGCCEKA